jgi:hypothetical protein
LIKIICPWTKIVLSVRDPVERLWSSFNPPKDNKDVQNMNRTFLFMQDVDRQIERLRRWGYTNAPTISEYYHWTQASTQQNKDKFVPTYVNQSHFHIQPKIRTLEAHNKVGAYGIVRGMYSMQIQFWIKHFSLGKSLLVIPFGDVEDPTQVNGAVQFLQNSKHRLSLSGVRHQLNNNNHDHHQDQQQNNQQNPIQRAKRQVLDDILTFAGTTTKYFHWDSNILDTRYGPHAGIRHPRTESQSGQEKNVPYSSTTMPTWMRSYLENFYEPFNSDLAQILGIDDYNTMWRR